MFLLTIAVTMIVVGPLAFDEDLPPDSQRMTPLVRVIQQIEPAVVALAVSRC
jgi:hypothetical protein